MRTGTRRMWSRRVLRAGWMLAPVLRIPLVIWNFFFGSTEAKIWSSIILVVGSLMTACTHHAEHMSAAATGEEIEKTMAGDSCMLELMPRRQRLDRQGQPLTNYDLQRGREDCQKYWKDVAKLKEQSAAMRKIGAK